MDFLDQLHEIIQVPLLRVDQKSLAPNLEPSSPTNMGHVERSAFMLEYDRIRPATAAASTGPSRPPLLLRGGRTGPSGGEEERPDKEAAWVLDGWGDEPSVPDQAFAVSCALSRFSKDVPGSLPEPPLSRRAVSAGNGSAPGPLSGAWRTPSSLGASPSGGRTTIRALADSRRNLTGSSKTSRSTHPAFRAARIQRHRQQEAVLMARGQLGYESDEAPPATAVMSAPCMIAPPMSALSAPDLSTMSDSTSVLGMLQAASMSSTRGREPGLIGDDASPWIVTPGVTPSSPSVRQRRPSIPLLSPTSHPETSISGTGNVAAASVGVPLTGFFVSGHRSSATGEPSYSQSPSAGPSGEWPTTSVASSAHAPGFPIKGHVRLSSPNAQTQHTLPFLLSGSGLNYQNSTDKSDLVALREGTTHSAISQPPQAAHSLSNSASSNAKSAGTHVKSGLLAQVGPDSPSRPPEDGNGRRHDSGYPMESKSSCGDTPPSTNTVVPASYSLEANKASIGEGIEMLSRRRQALLQAWRATDAGAALPPHHPAAAPRGRGAARLSQGRSSPTPPPPPLYYTDAAPLSPVPPDSLPAASHRRPSDGLPQYNTAGHRLLKGGLRDNTTRWDPLLPPSRGTDMFPHTMDHRGRPQPSPHRPSNAEMISETVRLPRTFSREGQGRELRRPARSISGGEPLEGKVEGVVVVGAVGGSFSHRRSSRSTGDGGGGGSTFPAGRRDAVQPIGGSSADLIGSSRADPTVKWLQSDHPDLSLIAPAVNRIHRRGPPHTLERDPALMTPAAATSSASGRAAMTVTKRGVPAALPPAG